jgi:hypothetical protein
MATVQCPAIFSSSSSPPGQVGLIESVVPTILDGARSAYLACVALCRRAARAWRDIGRQERIDRAIGDVNAWTHMEGEG